MYELKCLLRHTFRRISFWSRVSRGGAERHLFVRVYAHGRVGEI